MKRSIAIPWTRSRIRELAQRLSRKYGDPRLHNKSNALSELIFIILSAKTSESSYLRTYRALRNRFPNWFDLLSTPRGTVSRIIEAGGLSRRKEDQIRSLLEEIRVHAEKRNNLALLSRMATKSAERFLTSLPGVGLKTARCVLMYSENRAVFPVDTHVRRIMHRLGIMEVLRLTDSVQDSIQGRVPPSVRYKLHVNLVAHGRATCRSRMPLCDACVVNDMCGYFIRKRAYPFPDNEPSHNSGSPDV